MINLSNLLQQFCCKLNCFDLAYLLILAWSVVPRPSLTTGLDTKAANCGQSRQSYRGSRNRSNSDL